MPGAPIEAHLPLVLAALGQQLGANTLVDSSKRLSMALRYRAVVPTSFLWIRRAWSGGRWVRREEGRVEQSGFGRTKGMAWFLQRRLEVNLAARMLPGAEITYASLQDCPDKVLDDACAAVGLRAPVNVTLAYPHVLTANRCRFIGGRPLGRIRSPQH
jgi:hypothetical protein